MDDFDDLLDEVEKDIEKSSKKSKISKLPEPVSCSPLDEEIDSILNDHDEVVDVTQQKKKAQQHKSFNQTKCKFLYLGGSKTPTGMCSVTSKRIPSICLPMFLELSEYANQPESFHSEMGLREALILIPLTLPLHRPSLRMQS